MIINFTKKEKKMKQAEARKRAMLWSECELQKDK